MTIEIHEKAGRDEYEHVATFEDGEWVEGGDTVDPNDYYVEGPEEVLYSDFEGPYWVALDPDNTVPAEEYEDADTTKPSEPSGNNQMTLTKAGRVYVDRVEEAPDDVVVHVEDGGDDGDDRLYYEP